MKKLFTVFPLLKSWKFYLAFSLLLIAAFAAGFLYLPEEKNLSLPFDEEKGEIEKALAIAEEKLLFCTEEEKASILEEKAFFEGALKFRLSPWSSYFAESALTLYAHLSATEETKALTELEKILANRDKAGLVSFANAYSDFLVIDTRLLAAEDEPENAGQNALLYEIALLEESLQTGKDAYFGTQKSLSDSEERLFTRLMEQKEKTLAKGEYNPVPANRETLLLCERFFAALLTVLLLALAGKSQGERPRDKFLFLIPMIFSLCLLSLTLYLTTLLRAPSTVEPYFLPWGATLPFFPAQLLRLGSRLLGSLPLTLFCLAIKKRSIWKILAFSPVLRFLLQSSVILLPRTLARTLLWGEFAECTLPSLAPYSLRAIAPFAGILLWLFALAASLYFLLRKEQKLSPVKQKISLEKSSDL